MNGVVGEEDDTLVLHKLVNIILNYKSKITLRTRDPNLILDMYLPSLSNPPQEKQKSRYSLSDIKQELRANRTPSRISIDNVT